MSYSLIHLYQDKYNYKVVKEVPEQEALEKLGDLIKRESFRKRRKIFEEQYLKLKVMKLLSADIISLPLEKHGRYWGIRDKTLFIGGVERRVKSILKLPSVQDGRLIEIYRTNALYTGDLPVWVVEKYRLAKSYCTDVVVVSKDERLFDLRVVVEACPLLIGRWKDNDLFLLAAWGIEHELPKELGGLL